MSNLIAPSKALGYSNIFLDFLAGAPPAKTFYPAQNLEDVARALESRDYRRDDLCRILAEQNRLYGCSDSVFENIDKLKNERAVCLFAGQQPGLFGGALLVVYKALSLAKAAKLYTQQLGRPVVPVFWISGDDHDFDEVNHTWVLNSAYELTRVAYDARPSEEMPVADIRFAETAGLEKAKSELRQALGERDFTAELFEMLDRAYTSNDTFVSAFGKFMAALTRDLGLVLFSPGDAAAKRLAADLFRQIIESGEDLQRCFDDTNAQIESSGYHLQVEKSQNAAHLFYHVGGRTPLKREGDRYVAGEKSFSRRELFELIDKYPERFSPDVITRPVLQSYLFPVVSQKGGAAEIAYLAQTSCIFELLSLPTPYYRARPSVTILEKRFEQMMGEYEIGFEELTGDIEKVINRVLAGTFPEDLETKFGEFKTQIRERFRQFSGKVLQFDPGLSSLAEQTLGKIDYAIKGFEGKVFSSHKKKSQQTRDRIYRLQNLVYPNRAFQERSLNVTYLLSKYGRGIVRFLYDSIDSEEQAHQIINLSEYGG